MTPLDAHHVLLVVGWALHFAFVSFVVTGTGTVLVSALRRRNAAPGPLERVFADWLPVSLSGAITAAIVPLLFVQTLHPLSFYSASIVLFWRAVPLLPALVIGFYLLYVVKARKTGRMRAVAAAGSLLCWLFAAFTWSSIHVLTSGGWTAAFVGGPFSYWPPGLLARVAAWLALMVPVGMTAASWFVRGRDDVPYRGMAMTSWAGTVAAAIAGLAYLDASGRSDATWLSVMLAGLVVMAIGWAPMLASRPKVTLAAAVSTCGALVALAGASLLREATRGAAPDDARAVTESVVEGQGLTTFLVFTVLVTVAIVWIFRAVARDLRSASQ